MKKQTKYEQESVSTLWGFIIFFVCILLGMLADNL